MTIDAKTTGLQDTGQPDDGIDGGDVIAGADAQQYSVPSIAEQSRRMANPIGRRASVSVEPRCRAAPFLSCVRRTPSRPL